MTKKGFTIIELLIVIAIISILVGVAVPYYNDYIYDARLSTLKQNLATYRSVLNQFRGDNSRGPFALSVNNAGVPILVDPKSGNALGSELVSGPIQNVDGTITRRSNLKYLESMPVFLNPQDGSPVPTTAWTLGNPSAYFYDLAPNNGIFDIDTEFAFVVGDSDTDFDDGFDLQILNTVVWPGAGATTALDYTAFTITIDGVTY
ncbi:MAG: hypothetical protein A2W80_14775 [Candidatus Riflebacteria bacterium GWC2_50_8]|nr:MAG: hypothetical protein A2W80_14775 [Candidatus Riflebacteria bacterium GWC2_50_8]